MPDHKYMLHSTEDFTGVCTNRSIKYGLVRPTGNRTDSVKHYKRSEKKMEEGAESSQEAEQDAI